MRVALAGFLHETNTFAPVPADLSAFEAGGGYIPFSRGADLVRRAEGVNLGISGALRSAGRLGWVAVPILWAGAIPSAAVTRHAFETIASELVAGLDAAGPFDGVFLDLHGAMVAEHIEDGELEIARRVRETVGPDVPIVAALDLHGNVSEDFARCVDGLVGFRTYPHVDMADTGARAADLLHRIMTNGSRPACAFRRMSYLVPIPFQTTDAEPGRGLYSELATIETAERDVRAASLFMGFPAADVPECGPTAIVYADTVDSAERAADRLASSYADAESRFAGNVFGADEAIRTAMAAANDGGPVVIADTQDNPGAGGVSATTGMLRALMEAGAENAALGLIVDPETAEAAHEAGESARVLFRIGGHAGVPGDDPVETEAWVEHLSDGKLSATGPYYGGTELDLGPSACLRIDGLRVVVTSRIAQMADREMFRFVGIVPEDQKILVVKSSTHFRADFAPIASDILVAVAPGPMPLDPAELPFTRLRPDLRLSPNGPAFGDLRAGSARPDTGDRAGVQHQQDVIQQGRHP